jgi:polyhydroxyalkanoate synthesis regulator phasin
MRPLTPQTPARVAWEDAMLEAMQAMCDDLTRSDAQGLSEIADELVDKLYAWGDFTPEQAARVVLGWPHEDTPQGNGDLARAAMRAYCERKVPA